MPRRAHVSTQVLQRGSDGLARRGQSFSTHCGSAISVRPSATKSALPFPTAAVAMAGRQAAQRDHRHAHRLLHLAGEVEEWRIRRAIGGIITCAVGSER